MKIGLVILNRNESEGVSWLLPRLSLTGYSCVFAVDGFSTDDSAEKLRDAKIEVLVQQSSGRGEAFKLAFVEAKNRNLDALCFISSDGNEDPKDLPRMMGLLEEGYDLVIASRMLKDSFNEEDVSWFRPRKWANKIFSAMGYLVFAGSKDYISDPINGYRGMSVKTWGEFQVSSSGFGIEYETSLKAYVSEKRYIEFPTREGARVGGKSTASPMKTSFALISAFRETQRWKQVKNR